ncbi:hypothetical protein ONZ51_g4950 [Trametes cubensis]|uniref:Uncharacterized protein n=1 Tax=Trametes cubensis TaxID=1111947 RepID=A0AAD7TXB3_9APHY|nr:hypothetical protein ONZ51_g4950 [Trametes cubensis]
MRDMPCPSQSSSAASSTPSSVSSSLFPTILDISLTPGHGSLSTDAILEILRFAAHRGDLNNVRDLVLAAYTDLPAKRNVLHLFALTLVELGFDFNRACRAQESLHYMHCARCHAWYDTREERGTQECVVPHADPVPVFFRGTTQLIPGMFYPCCGLNEVMPMILSSSCYVGPHTPSPQPLSVALRVGTCRDMGCYFSFPICPPSPPLRSSSSSSLHTGHRSAASAPKPGPVPGASTSVPTGIAAPSALGLYTGEIAASGAPGGAAAPAAAVPAASPPGTAPLAWPQPPEVETAGVLIPAAAPANQAEERPAWRNSSLYHPPGWIPTRLPGER